MRTGGETRTGLLNIIAACIIAGGLVGGALILAHRPVGTGSALGARTTVPAARLTTPPISQASAAAQLRAQVLAVPTLHTFVLKKTTYTLADVKVTQVIYDPKRDAFSLRYTYIWQPTMPTDGPRDGTDTFVNDGYGRYYRDASIRIIGSEVFQSGNITLK